MKLSTTSAGKALGFSLKRLNYATVHVTIGDHDATVVMSGAGATLEPRQIVPVEGVGRRIVWVCPPEWASSFPERIRFTRDTEGEPLAELADVDYYALSGMAEVPATAAHRAPFPSALIEFINRDKPGAAYDPAAPWPAEQIAAFAEDLRRLKAKLGRLGYFSPAAQYFGFLRRVNAAMQFALKHFPDVNTTALRHERFHGIATHPDEMMTMAHHLYVLNAAGVRGGLAEFGCFKGFSTSCLSHACAELGLRMHVFDSFEGLPPSESGRYLTGEYAGSFSEVTRHVRDFGRDSAVSWHKGFFSSTIDQLPQGVGAFWLDVDLKESAADVMKGLDRLDPRGCVFSHELAPPAFDDGQPNEALLAEGKFEVLPPMLDAVRARSGTVSGQHLCRSLGVVYLPGSIQVLPFETVQQLLALAE